MTHTQTPPSNQSESDTSCLDSHISDKQDSKALLLLLLLLLLLWWLLLLHQLLLLASLLDRAGDERLHADRRSIYTGFR